MVPPYVLAGWVRVSVSLLWCDVILAESRRGECDKCCMLCYRFRPNSFIGLVLLYYPLWCLCFYFEKSWKFALCL